MSWQAARCTPLEDKSHPISRESQPNHAPPPPLSHTHTRRGARHDPCLPPPTPTLKTTQHTSLGASSSQLCGTRQPRALLGQNRSGWGDRFERWGGSSAPARPACSPHDQRSGLERKLPPIMKTDRRTVGGCPPRGFGVPRELWRVLSQGVDPKGRRSHQHSLSRPPPTPLPHQTRTLRPYSSKNSAAAGAAVPVIPASLE
jgi:hypothetical protein